MVSAPLDPWIADRYYTDGVSLFRLVSLLMRPNEPTLVEIEDCESLYTTLVEVAEVDELALHPVALEAGHASRSRLEASSAPA
jgi:hypothetical protein